jgi:GntR family carbon starvation induced transcriptional regulator
VREALSRLVADGWVKAIDQRGFRVCPVSIEDLQDITRTRIDVESIALRRSIEAGDLAWEGRILAAYHELSGATPQRVEALKDSMLAWSVSHRRFHGALVSACGSPWLLRFRDTLTDQSERYRKLSVSYATAPRDVDHEHKQIMQAALERDADACIAQITKHFQQTANVVLASVQARLQNGDPGDAP